MHYFNLDQFRTTTNAGGVLSVSIVAEGGTFHIEAETRGGNAVLTKTRSTDLRQFRDATKALTLLRELGIREAKVDTRNWRPEQADLGKATRPDRTKAMRFAQEAVEHDRWFREQVEAGLKEMQEGKTIPLEEVKRRWSEKRANLLKLAENAAS